MDNILKPHTLSGKLRIAVIGGNGFIGSYFIYRMRNQGNIVIYSVDTKQSYNYIHLPKDSPLILNQISLDINSPGTIQTFLMSTDVDVVVFCAGAESPRVGMTASHKIEVAVMDGLVNTLTGTVNIRTPKPQKKPHFIYLSSASVYGSYKGNCTENVTPRPDHYSGHLKLAAENLVTQYMESHGHDFTILRLSEVFGRQSDYNLKQIDAGYWRGYLPLYVDLLVQRAEEVEVYSPKTKYDFVHVNYVAKFISAVIYNRTTGIFNIGSGNKLTLKELIHEIKNSLPDSVTKVKGSNRFTTTTINLDCTKAHEFLPYEGNYNLNEFLADYIPIRQYEIGKGLAIGQILSEPVSIDSTAYGAKEALRLRKEDRLKKAAQIMEIAGEQYSKINYGTTQERTKRLLQDDKLKDVQLPKDRAEYLKLLEQTNKKGLN